MASPRTDGSGPSPTASDGTSSPPSPDRPRKGRLVVVAGPSGVGKTSIVEKLRRHVPFHFSVSATTRPPRPGERDGVEYHFVDDAEFARRIAAGELLEWAVYNGRRYGTPRGAVMDHLADGDDVVLDIEVQGAAQVHAAYPQAIMVFISPPSLDVLAARLAGRGDTAREEAAARLDIARRELEVAGDLFDHVVVNDDMDRAVAEVLGILRASEETSSP